MECFLVFLNNRLIDRVYYNKGTTSEEAKKFLVDHDGYSYNIIVRKEK